MITRVRTQVRVSLNLAPSEAALLVKVLGASSGEEGIRQRIEALYSDLYKSLEDQGIDPMTGDLKLEKPVRQKSHPDDVEEECAVAPPAPPWPPKVGQEVEALAYGAKYIRTKILELDGLSFRVHVSDGHDQVEVLRDLNELRPVRS